MTMFEESTEGLTVTTRSLPTAACIWLVTGVQPRVEKSRFGSDPQFIFPGECEDTLRRFLRAKQAVEKLTAASVRA
jgi:hypothetical protein